MYPSGRLHLGHYRGVLQNWLKLQHEYECLFFVADWHALTRSYETPRELAKSTREMLIDWLAVGIQPGSATLFMQSRVPQLAELHLLLSMLTPLSWLKRSPGFKDHQLQLKEQDLLTYGMLGYPLLQSADILLYRAGLVSVGGGQDAHVEIARDVAKRFNHLYGREPDFEAMAELAIARMGRKLATLYRKLRQAYMEQGDNEALQTARALLEDQYNLSIADRERLLGYLEGAGRVLLPEPQVLREDTITVPGLDGERMSASAGNVIELRESPESISEKLMRMPTDPARCRRNDPGDPARCPVWQWHQVYSEGSVCEWAQEGCRSAAIGCVDCKRPLIDSVIEELSPVRERAREYEGDPDLLRAILSEGSERARDEAQQTMIEIHNALGMDF